MMMKNIPTILLIAGAAVVAVGIGLIDVPAGVIAGGLAMIAVGLLSMWGGGSEDDEH